MSLAFLPEHAENARLALELAVREATHLAYTHRTLYAHAEPRNVAETRRMISMARTSLADAQLSSLS